MLPIKVLLFEKADLSLVSVKIELTGHWGVIISLLARRCRKYIFLFFSKVKFWRVVRTLLTTSRHRCHSHRCQEENAGLIVLFPLFLDGLEPNIWRHVCVKKTFPFSEHVKDSLSTTMQCAPRRRFRGPRNPKVLRRHLKAVQICLHPSHPSEEWIEIFLWSYEIYQGTIGAVLI